MLQLFIDVKQFYESINREAVFEAMMETEVRTNKNDLKVKEQQALIDEFNITKELPPSMRWTGSFSI